MKLQIVSDLHLEFNESVRIKNAGADILCLAGDICLAQDLYRHPASSLGINKAENGKKAAYYRRFFDQVSKEFDQVLYIMGNHEHYRSRWNDTASNLREALEPWSNITLMDDSWLNFGDTRIVGTTLWTDLNKGDPLTMMNIKSMMNDYNLITIKRGELYHKLRPVDTLEAHNRAMQLIKLATESWDGKIVILGHHSPSHKSIAPHYRNNELMNGGYHSDLSDYILSQDKIKLWIHGHTHNSFDYTIGECRVICNPYGYRTENIASFDPNLIVEI